MKPFSKLSIREKITISFAIIILLIGIPLIFNINSLIYLYKISNENLTLYKARVDLLQIERLNERMVIYAKKVLESETKTELLNSDEQFEQSYRQSKFYLRELQALKYTSKEIYNIKDTAKSISELLSNTKLYYNVIKQNKLKLIKSKQEHKTIPSSILEKKLKNIKVNYDAIEQNSHRISKKVKNVNRELSNIIKKKESLIKNRLENAKKLSLIWFTILVLVSFVIIFLISSEIGSQLTNISSVIRQISTGFLPDYKVVDADNEIGYISQAIKNLIFSLKETTNFTSQLASGNFDSEISPLSDKDELRNLLLDLRDSLKRAREEQEKREIEDLQRRKISEGLAKFADILRGHQKNLKELAEDIIIQLVRYLDSVQGAFFILNDNDPQHPYLELLAAYAWNRKKYFEKRINIGEGLIGAVALEKFTIHITDVPEDYIEIKSGIGESDPRAILIVPLTVEENVLGAIELASLKEFKDYEIELVEKIAESIAATLQNIKINEKTEELLKITRKQTEEMKRQEELMRKNIEELKKMIKEKTLREQELRERVKSLEKNLTTEKVKSQKVQEELKKIKEELNKLVVEIEFYKRLINQFEKPLLIIDKDNKIQYVNEVFKKEFGEINSGITLNELFEEKLEHIQIPEDIKNLNDKTARAKQTRKLYKIRLIYIPTLSELNYMGIILEPLEKEETLSEKMKEKILSYQINLFKLQRLIQKHNIEADIEKAQITIEWEKKYETGIETIDNQHKKWIEIINKLIKAIEEKNEEALLGQIFNELIEFTRFHFSFEEKYMDEYGYEMREDHKIRHNEFISNLLSLFNRYIKGDVIAALELLDILTNWVIRHVTETDKKYVALFKSKGLK